MECASFRPIAIIATQDFRGILQFRLLANLSPIHVCSIGITLKLLPANQHFHVEEIYKTYKSNVDTLSKFKPIDQCVLLR